MNNLNEQPKINNKSTFSDEHILVSGRMRSNPVLKFFHQNQWKFGNILADFVVSEFTCILFLSLQYHLSNKNYIIERMESLKGRYNLRILMGYVDIEDSDLAIQGLTKLGIDNDWCLNIIWSHEEGARYIQSYKSVSKKGPQLIVGENQSNDNFQASLDCLTQIKGINTNNAQDLLIKFGSFAEIVKAPTTTTMLIDGIGQTKIKEMLKVFQTPFFPKDNDEQKKDDLEKNKYKKYKKSSNSHENWNMSSNFNKK